MPLLFLLVLLIRLLIVFPPQWVGDEQEQDQEQDQEQEGTAPRILAFEQLP